MFPRYPCTTDCILKMYLHLKRDRRIQKYLQYYYVHILLGPLEGATATQSILRSTWSSPYPRSKV